MNSVLVGSSSTESVKDFVNAVSHYPFDVDMHSGRYIVDAKSLLGIFSLDLAKPITCEIYSDNCAELLKDIAKFIVK